MLRVTRSQMDLAYGCTICYSNMVRIQSLSKISIRERKTQVESGGVPLQASLCSLPPVNSHTASLGNKNATRHVQCFCQGSLLETQQLRLLLWIGHVDTFCLACTKSPDFSRRRVGIQHDPHYLY